MARYTGPSWKISRRLKYSILETGEELVRRPYAPGQHGKNNSKKKISEYGVQLQEKQKVRYTYGMTEKQFKKVFNQASKMKGKHGDNFLILLETRLDNLVYRLGIALTRRQARQLVCHGHITVNGKKLDIPSYQCKPGDKIGLKENSKNLTVVRDALSVEAPRVAYVSFDADKMEGEFVRMPERNEF